MIDSNFARAFTRVAERQNDVLHAFEPGFEPERSDVAGRAGAQPDANPLHAVAPEGAYFVAGGPGPGVSFSRAGAFEIASGELRFAGDARPVLGFAIGRPGAVVPLAVDPYDAALGHVSDARLEADGTFAYSRSAVDPRTGERRSERIAVGRIALARFPAGTQPERIDATHVRPPAGVAPVVGVPGDGRFGGLTIHARDLGRVDIFAGLDRLREAYDDLEAGGAAYKAHFSIDRTTMDLLK